jgi:hypothetical protein
MPVDLRLHGRPIGTVFDLLGTKENDITYSVGWALSQSPGLATVLIEDVLPRADEVLVDVVLLQEGVPGAGFTDIELKINESEFHIVIEAKRGYDLPEESQLAKYATRSDPQPDLLVVMAEAPTQFVDGKLPAKVEGVDVLYRSWRELDQMVVVAATRSRSHSEKRLLRELSRYLRGLMTMQNVSSNLVYVVSLGGEIEETGISFRDVVLEHDTYFCPVGGGPGRWPKEPPNYLGFRFDGQLQEIRHVDSYRIVADDHAGFEPLAGKVSWDHERHWLFQLGPAIVPPEPVKNGKLWPTHRGWIAIDLLLTSKTVAEARDKTSARLEASGEESE